MKLMTEMQDGCVHALGYCVDTESVKPLEVAKLEHDAAAAHALMQAVRQYEQDFPLSPAVAQDVIQWIEKRADEIMREWGYESEAGK